MEFRVEELAPCRKKVTVIVPADRVRKEIDGQYAEVNKQIALPGFRPGKAPRKLLESRFGVHVQGEVKQKLVEAAYKQLIEEKRIAPLTQPDVDVDGATADPAKAFEFAFEVTTRPDFELPGWKGLEVKVPPVERLRRRGRRRRRANAARRRAILVPSEAGAAADDVVVLDWEAVEGDAPVHAETSSYYRWAGGVLDGVVVDGLDAKLMGATRRRRVRRCAGKAPPDDRAPGARGARSSTSGSRSTRSSASSPPTSTKRSSSATTSTTSTSSEGRPPRHPARQGPGARPPRRGAAGRPARRVGHDRASRRGRRTPPSTDWTERRRVEAQAEGRDADEVSKRADGGCGRDARERSRATCAATSSSRRSPRPRTSRSPSRSSSAPSNRSHETTAAPPAR